MIKTTIAVATGIVVIAVVTRATKCSGVIALNANASM